MYACMTPVGFDTSDKFENHCLIPLNKVCSWMALHGRKFESFIENV